MKSMKYTIRWYHKGQICIECHELLKLTERLVFIENNADDCSLIDIVPKTGGQNGQD